MVLPIVYVKCLFLILSTMVSDTLFYVTLIVDVLQRQLEIKIKL